MYSIDITMPSTIKSNKWFFRVTMPHKAISELWERAMIGVKFIDMTRCLMVAHVGEKTEKEHVHCIIEINKEIQKQSFDVRIKSVFGVSGADYSSKPWDGNMEHGAGSYLYHDPDAYEVYFKGFTLDDIDRFKRCNQQIQEVVQENKSRASGRCVERTLAIITESNRYWTRAEIAMRLLKDIREDKMYECGDFVLRKYIEEIYAKQLKDTEWEQYASIRSSNLVRQEDIEITHPI